MTCLVSFPDLTGHPELQLGDLFLNHTSLKYWMYMWSTDPVATTQSWVVVCCGDVRDDAKCLIVLEEDNCLLWVPES